MDKNTVDGQDEFTPYLAIELTGPILLHLTQDFHLASRVSMSTRMPTRSSYHLRNSSITFECSTTYMDTERHMSATVLETVLVDQDSFETVNNGALIINQSKLIKSRILHLLHDMCCGKTVRDESLTKHACSVTEGVKGGNFNVSVSQTRTSTCLSHKHKLVLVPLTRKTWTSSTRLITMTSSQPVHFSSFLFFFTFINLGFERSWDIHFLHRGT